MTSKVVDLFDEQVIGPSAGQVPSIGGAGGGLPETYAREGDFVYRAGQAISVGEMRAGGATGNMESYMLSGGARRQRKTRKRKSRSRSRSRRQAGGSRRAPRFRLNVRAQIRLRSQRRQ